ncbi:MAG: protoheme IX farnesyltransferase [Bacteroidales bacterium]
MNKNRFVRFFFIVIELGKIKISIPVALTGFMGYYRASGELHLDFLYMLFGILFMSMGSSTFNQVQERRTDLLMKRTAGRPLPAGRISMAGAITTGVLLSLAGMALLFLTGSPIAALIGLFTLGWYNLVYTPLKHVTPFAVLPGALIGALPPLIGWTAAGGAVFDREIMLISFFLFIGQMPHYWLLLLKVGHEFSTAGMPVITDKFSKIQLRDISFIWIVASAVFVLIFPVSGIMYSNLVSFLMLGGVIIILVRIFQLSLHGEVMQQWRKTFMAINLFYLFIILILIADKFAEPYLYSWKVI